LVEKKGFLETVHSAWSSPISGSPSFVWEHKLKATKHALKSWVKNPTNTPLSHRQEIVQQLSDLQVEMETKDIFNSDLEKEQVAQSKTFRAFRHEEEYWRLKSQSLWLKDGDRNTSFFHRQFKARLSRNHIS
jgi:hypothetical protein